jgi:hypothetical protein
MFIAFGSHRNARVLPQEFARFNRFATAIAMSKGKGHENRHLLAGACRRFSCATSMRPDRPERHRIPDIKPETDRHRSRVRRRHMEAGQSAHERATFDLSNLRVGHTMRFRSSLSSRGLDWSAHGGVTAREGTRAQSRSEAQPPHRLPCARDAPA